GRSGLILRRGLVLRRSGLILILRRGGVLRRSRGLRGGLVRGRARIRSGRRGLSRNGQAKQRRERRRRHELHLFLPAHKIHPPGELKNLSEKAGPANFSTRQVPNWKLHKTKDKESHIRLGQHEESAWH